MSEHLPDVIWTADADLHITSVMHTGSGQAGAAPDWDQHLADETRKFREHYLNALAGRPVTYETSIGGSHYRVHVEPLRNAPGEIVGCVAAAFEWSAPLLAETAFSIQELLDQLHTVTSQLSQAPTLDTLYRQGIELGRSHLGFDRLSIWLVDDDPQYVRGTWGTDEQGQMRDERDIRRPMETTPVSGEALSRSQNLLVRENTPLFNHNGDVVSDTGWSAVVGLWIGQQLIGWLSTDNLIQRKPLLPYQLNLLKWYGDVLSSLCALKRVEDALSRSERRFRAIFEGANVGIAVIDRAGYLMVCNPTCHQIFGYSAHELRYRAFSDLLDPDSRVGYLESFAQLLRGEIASFQFEKQGIRRGGEKIWVNINMSIFPSPAAQNSYIVAYVEDITERKWNEKRTQELILEREQVKLLTEFVQTISHDLRTPLAIINTSLYLLERASDSEKKQYYSNKISDQVLRVSSLVDGLLGMVKWDSHASYTLEEVDVNALISSVGVDMGTLAAEKSLTLKFDLGANIPKLTADWFALGEALTNIVKNAVQYTPAEGSVVVRSRAHSSHAVIEVQDTGIGIEAQDLRHIFDRLYRADKARSTHGIGLGLPIARKIVEAHGGRIEVESTPGKGSLFRMVLPYKPEGILL